MSVAGIFGPLLGDSEIELILGDHARAQAMVTVEIALAKVEGRLGVIPADAGAAIEAALAGYAPDLEDLARGTAAAGVPVPALVAQLRRQVGGDAATYVHWGATSQDILDTALVLQLREALALLARRLDQVSDGPGPAGERASRHTDHRPDALPASRAYYVRAQGRWLAGTVAAPSRPAGRAEATPPVGSARRRRWQSRGHRRSWRRRHDGTRGRTRVGLRRRCPGTTNAMALVSSPPGFRWSQARSASSARTCCCWRRTRSARCARRMAAAPRPCRRNRTPSGPRPWSRWHAATRRCSAACTRRCCMRMSATEHPGSWNG